MTREDYPLISSNHKKVKTKKILAEYTLQDAILELEELKNIALNCLDKNGNPNLSIAMKAVENKAKIAGLYKSKNINTVNAIQMGEIKIDGQQLKLNIGEEIDS